MYGQNPYSQYPYTGYAYPNYGNRQFMQPQQQMAQPQQQVQQQPMQPVMPTLCYAKMEEAKPYIITEPNTSMLFIDRGAGKALLKTTDNVCNSYPRYFNIIETDENGNPLQAKKEEVSPQIDYGQFMKKDEVDKLGLVRQDQLNALIDKLQFMQNQINALNKPKTNEKVLGKGNTQDNE